MEVRIFDSVCDCCGHYREPTAEEMAYEEAVEALIVAARAVGRKMDQIRFDLKDNWHRHHVADVAKLDKDVVRLWWIDARKRALVS